MRWWDCPAGRVRRLHEGGTLLRCSVFGVRCSVFGVRCSVFGFRTKFSIEATLGPLGDSRRAGPVWQVGSGAGCGGGWGGTVFEPGPYCGVVFARLWWGLVRRGMAGVQVMGLRIWRRTGFWRWATRALLVAKRGSTAMSGIPRTRASLVNCPSLPQATVRAASAHSRSWQGTIEGWSLPIRPSPCSSIPIPCATGFERRRSCSRANSQIHHSLPICTWRTKIEFWPFRNGTRNSPTIRRPRM